MTSSFCAVSCCDKNTVGAPWEESKVNDPSAGNSELSDSIFS